MAWWDTVSRRLQGESIPRWLRIGLTLALVGMMGVFCWQHAKAIHLDYHPTNGTFQTWNPQRRLEAGQWIGRDFQPYLGLGPTLSIRAASIPTAARLADVLWATNLCCGLAMICSALLLGRWCGLSWLGASLAVVCLLALGFSPDNAWLAEQLGFSLPGLMQHLYLPANSNLGLRCFVPVLTAAWLYVLSPWMSGQCSPHAPREETRRRGGKNGFSHFQLGLITRSVMTTLRVHQAATVGRAGATNGRGFTAGWLRFRRIIIAGTAAGAALIWSNDYGPPTFASICLVWGLLPAIRRCVQSRLVETCGIVLVGIAMAFMLLCLATAFSPLRWLQYNAGVAADQFWYFPGEKVCRLAELPLGPLEAIGILAALFLGRRVFQGVSQPGEPLLLHVLVSTLAAEYLSAVGGSKSFHYSLPLERVCLFAVPYCICVAFGSRAAQLPSFSRDPQGRAPLGTNVSCVEQRAPLRVAPKRSNAPRLDRHCWTALTLSGAIWLCGDFVGRLPELTQSRYPPRQDTLPVPELGGELHRNFDSIVALGREWAAREGGPPLVFSTYATGAEALAGLFQPSGHDYIIHALGPRERQRYVEFVRETVPELVVTQRDSYPLPPGYGCWEGWARRVNWEFYRELFARFQPAEEAFYCTVWERRQTPLVALAVPVDVQAALRAEHRLELTVTLPEHPSLAPGPHYIDVQVDAAAHWTPDRWRQGGIRQYAWVQTEAPFADQNISQFGVPLGRGPLRFPVEVAPGQSVKVTLNLRPAEASHWELTGCSARHVISRAEVDLFKPRRLRTSSLCDVHWTHGVWSSRSGPTSFFVNDASLLRGIVPGDRVVFAKSGQRKIIGIQREQVQVDGPPLDPAGDGYPHAVWVVQ